MESNDKLRISDADRELVSKLLKVAIDEGRLTLAEYDERLRQAYEAKTVGELAPIISDLPRADGAVEVVRPRLVSIDPEETGVPSTKGTLHE